jgi:hypothetical protein
MLSDPSSIFQIFNTDNKDKLSRVMQVVGKIAFTTAFITAIIGETFSKTVDAHKVLEILVGVGGGGGFFLGIFMFIGVGARITGEQNGVTSFPLQILRIVWKTFLYFLLPMLILTLLLVIFVHPKS